MSMTSEEKQAFLEDLHVGVLGLNDPDRGPLTVPVWYDYEAGGHLWFIIGAESRKGQLIEVGTRVSMVAQTESPPYKYVSVEGPVVSVDPSSIEAITDMAIRYLGEKQGHAYAGASNVEGQIVVRVDIKRWLAVDYSKG